MKNNKSYINPWNNPLGVKDNMSEECKHKMVLENQRLVCEYCGETFKL